MSLKAAQKVTLHPTAMLFWTRIDQGFENAFVFLFIFIIATVFLIIDDYNL